MTIEEAIKTLDGVIPAPGNKMVDLEHLPIAQAWATVKKSFSGTRNSEMLKNSMKRCTTPVYKEGIS